LEEEPDRSRDQGTAVNAYVAVNAYAAPPSTPRWPRLHRRPDVSAAVAFFTSFLSPCLLLVLDRRRRRAPLGPLSCLCAGHRATVLPPHDGALGLVMPPSSLSPCDEPLCSPAIVACVFCCRGCGAPPRRLESHPCFPGGCAGRAWRGRACLRHGCGPCTPPRAQGWPLASRAAWEAAATRWSLRVSIVPGSLLTSKTTVRAGWLLSRAGFGRLMRRTPRPVVPAVSAPSLVTGWTRCAQGRKLACRPAGAPQRCAATKLVASQAPEPCYARHPPM
jgi:hypothetical protein